MQDLPLPEDAKARAFVAHIARQAELSAIALGSQALMEEELNAQSAFVFVAAVRRDETGRLSAVAGRWSGCGACVSAALGQQILNYVSDQLLNWTANGHDCKGQEHGQGKG